MKQKHYQLKTLNFEPGRIENHTLPFSETDEPISVIIDGREYLTTSNESIGLTFKFANKASFTVYLKPQFLFTTELHHFKNLLRITGNKG